MKQSFLEINDLGVIVSTPFLKEFSKMKSIAKADALLRDVADKLSKDLQEVQRSTL